MMHPDLIATTIGSLVLGIAVLVANPRRPQNQAFGLMSVATLLWLVAIQLAFAADNNETAAFWVRVTSTAGILMPATVHVMRFAIRGQSLPDALRSAAGWVIASVLFAVYSWTPWYMKAAVVSGEPGSVPELIPGPGFSLYSAFLFLSLLLGVVLSITQARRLVGYARLEASYLAAAGLCMLSLGVFINSVLPVMLGTSQPVRFAYTWVVALTFITAYGISSDRLMGPGVILQRLCAYLIAGSAIAAGYLVLCIALRGLWGLPLTSAELIPGAIAAVLLSFYGRAVFLWARQFAVFEPSIDVTDVLRRIAPHQLRVSSVETLADHLAPVLTRASGAMGVLVFVGEGDRYTAPYLGGSQVLDNDDLVVRHLLTTGHWLSVDALARQGASASERELLERLQSLNLAVLIPVLDGERLVAMLGFEPKLSGAPYSRDDVEALAFLAGQLSVALENATLYSAVERAREHSARLTESIDQGLIACAADGSILTYNRRARELLPGERGPTCREIPAALGQVLISALKGNHAKQQRLEIAGHYLLADSGAYDDLSGQRLGAFVIFQDITEQELLRRRLRDREALCELLAEKAHDLKVPVSTLRIFAELLPRHYTDDEFRNQFAPLVLQEIRRIDSALVDLVHQERRSRQAEPADLMALVAGQVHRFEPAAHAEGIEIIAQGLHTGPAWAIVVREEFSEIIANLLKNAVEAVRPTAGPKQVFITARRDDLDTFHLEVADTGPGLPPGDPERLFQPFFTTKESSGGTGLGLYQVRQSLAAGGGTIRAANRPEGGALFALAFPCLSAAQSLTTHEGD